jgi:hypothetical protein
LIHGALVVVFLSVWILAGAVVVRPVPLAPNPVPIKSRDES